MAYKTSEAAKRVGKSPTWVRDKTAAFGDCGFSKIATPGKGKTRAYNDQDIIILATIADRKSEGVDNDAIRADLTAGEFVTVPPGAASSSPHRSTPDPGEGQLMTEREARISLQFAGLQGEFNTIKADNERYRTDLKAMTERAVRAETILEILSNSPGQESPPEEEKRPPAWQFWRR